MSGYFIGVGFLSAGLTIFINYCLGKPGSDKFSPYEIFSRYTVWLSIRRLKDVGLYSKYVKQYVDNRDLVKTKHEIITLNYEFNKMLYDAADPFFTWERAVGMCSVCSGFWVSLIVGLLFTWNFVALLVIILTSHVVIRILNKII